MNSRYLYPEGVITVTFEIYFAKDASKRTLSYSFEVYVVNCIAEGALMTVTSSNKNAVKENRFGGTGFMGSLNLHTDDSFTFDNASKVYIK